jgi:hypothetical protein
MIRRILAVVAASWLFSGPAVAQICASFPYTLTNGTTADASQVMANFNNVLNCANTNIPLLLRGWIAGLTMSNDATNPTTTIDTSAGIANSDDAAMLMPLAAFTKNANAGWAVGSGNGCLDSGTSLAASTWYHLFVIMRADTGVVDQLCSTSASAPTMPNANYTKKRRIGSFRTNSTSQILAFSQIGEEFLWKTVVNDANGLTVGTGGRSNVALTVPAGVQTNAIFTLEVGSNSAAVAAIVTSLDQLDNAPLVGQQDLWTNGANQWASGRFSVRTNTASQIGIRGFSATTSYYVNTLGWVDTRGRFQ